MRNSKLKAAALIITKPLLSLFLPRSPTPPPSTTLGKSLQGVSVYFHVGDEVVTLNMIKSAPVGPVAGGIMGCIMVLVLAVYAYRHQIHRRSHQHMSPLAAQGELRMNPTAPPGSSCLFRSFQGWKDSGQLCKPLDNYKNSAAFSASEE